MNILCPNCKYEGTGKFINKGSMGMEFILLICGVLPGLIYSVWRLSNRILICPQCRFEYVVKMKSIIKEKNSHGRRTPPTPLKAQSRMQ